MGLEIRYSLLARQEEIDLLDYILNRFGQKKAKQIFERIEKVLGEISIMPEMYPASTKMKNLRRCVFSKQTSIYYRINGNCIEVISIRGNRKDPDFKI